MSEAAETIVRIIADSDPVRRGYCRYCDAEAGEFHDLRDQPPILRINISVPRIVAVIHENNCTWSLAREECSLPAIVQVGSAHHFRAAAP